MRLITRELGFRNVFEGHADHARRTWHARRPVFSLDRIYVKNMVAKRAVRLHGEPWSELSDHLPLWAELSHA